MIGEAEMLARFERTHLIRENEWMVLCPAHADRNPSLHLTLVEDRWLLSCQAGCDQRDVLEHARLDWGDLFEANGNGKREIVAEYDYTDEDGALLFQVVRFAPKDFRQRRPDGAGGWNWRLNGCRRVLYRLPEIIAAIKAGQPVFVVEGEKDVQALEGQGLVATTCPAGAGKWKPEYSEALTDAQVTVIADRDDPGRAHARAVVAAIEAHAATVEIVEPATGKDVSDHLAAGKSIGELVEITACNDLAPSRPPVTDAPGWPEPMHEDAYHGLVGDVIRALEPHSEADPAAMLVQLLTAIGNALGRSPGWTVEATRHQANLFVAIVGDTSSGRKGTSWGQARRLVELADPSWGDRTATGLSSGEGMIWQVRDPIENRRKAKKEEASQADELGFVTELADVGVEDKRLLVVESELASVLERMGREGNTLSAVLRQAWDGERLDTLVKTNQARASDAHISVVGHITSDELRRKLTVGEQSNGFANRFLWVCARRARVLPFGGQLDTVDWAPLVERLSTALRYGTTSGLVDLDTDARTLWVKHYERLTEGGPGMLGAVTARAAAQVRRIAIIYALMDPVPDGVPIVTADHLRAALAVWDYSERSAAFLFGDATGDPTVDAIVDELLRAGEGGRTRNELRDLFGRHRRASELDRALLELERAGKITTESVQTGGRPATRYTRTVSAERPPATHPALTALSARPQDALLDVAEHGS